MNYRPTKNQSASYLRREKSNVITSLAAEGPLLIEILPSVKRSMTISNQGQACSNQGQEGRHVVLWSDFAPQQCAAT
ncbi:hypothetical protein CDAR_173741 [Caerostris darwini]|uniref:Uncharacterized protein n=1 Tax=Caerostris darwini TaxID=1538125 RepID=A0AAV4WK18_9ARAC|nr:hypothetical protein CDAR_173741 [Caerostris darwini]